MLAVVVFLIIQLRLIVIPLLVAMLLGALLVPFSQFLQRHRWPKWLAVTVAMLSALVVVGGLLALGDHVHRARLRRAAAQSLEAWDEFRQWLLDGSAAPHRGSRSNDCVEQAIASSRRQRASC